ncbi:helix-turn-helix domain-containing protein [Mucilaginibacter hurinus]|nr:AraC family transcriptional regulator [Mucilaginibacter hurinus]
MFDKISYRAKKNWVLLMVILTFLLVVYSNCFAFFDLSVQMNLNAFYRYSSLCWFVILFFMFKNPVIIFGESYLLQSINLTKPQTFQVWSNKPLKAIEDNDTTVYKTVYDKIDFIILEIKALQKSIALISAITLNTETLAKELKMPKRHLDVIFKYHCHYSINDFSNLVKIDHALLLINEGYLKKYTVDSLGKTCLFNSRFTFSTNFKKFVGVSVSDFVSSANIPEKDYQHLLS